MNLWTHLIIFCRSDLYVSFKIGVAMGHSCNAKKEISASNPNHLRCAYLYVYRRFVVSHIKSDLQP